jgi:hypothetical protein
MFRALIWETTSVMRQAAQQSTSPDRIYVAKIRVFHDDSCLARLYVRCGRRVSSAVGRFQLQSYQVSRKHSYGMLPERTRGWKRYVYDGRSQ